MGNFTSIDGYARYSNQRLNVDGSFDVSYSAPAADNSVRTVGLATNDDIYVGGQFVLYGGVDRPYMIRVTSSGNVGIFGTWPNAPVRTLAVQTDGKLIAGGDFTSIGGVSRNFLARLNADNSVDSTFNQGANNSVCSLALQTDGKILVGGTFTNIAGAAMTNLARLNSDGSIDSSFNAATLGAPNVLLIQPDGKILVGGDYSNTPAGVSYCRRLNADGSLDTSFNATLTQATNPGVYALSLQADGKIIVGGNFDSLGGAVCSNLARLFPDGSIDSSFSPVVGTVYSLGLQPDGRVLYGSPGILARLLNTDAAINNVSFDSSSVMWTHGGAGPEVWSATFDFTTNGIDWLSLPNGVRVPGGWQCVGLSLPPVPTIVRARGFVTGASWFDEELGGPPIITAQPGVNTTRNALTSVTFSVSAAGPSLVYQWLKNGAVFNPANGSGAQTASLTMSNLLSPDAGQYQCVISNSSGSVTSLVANLVVVDPYVSSQPVSVATNLGQTANFSIVGLGTLPLGYQWFKAGAALGGATTSSLTMSNVQTGDAATYFAIITNQYGSRTSSIVSLAVNAALPDTFAPVSGMVDAIAVQTDGKILVGNPVNSNFSPNPLRYNPDGSLDTNFSAAISNSAVGSIAVQTDGKILVSGYAADRVHRLWRLNNDGSADVAFTNTAPLPSGPVNCLAVQPDGKILLGGAFYIGAPPIRTNLARLNPDGSLDSGFPGGASQAVYSLALQPDGAILVGGEFTGLNGQNRAFVGRLKSDGSLDTNFNLFTRSPVYTMLLQSDSKILVGGLDSISRFYGNGAPDTNFHTGFSNNLLYVYSLALQTDGKILTGGSYAFPSGRGLLSRLNPDGTFDPYFFPIVSGTVSAIAIQSDGGILAGGQFTTVTGLARTNMARIVNPNPSSQSLSFDGSTINWQRAGSGPEVWRAAFETSSDGTNWTMPISGSRYSNGWQLSGLSLPDNTFLRARGFTVGGRYQASGWYVESLAQVHAPPRILVDYAGFGFQSGQFGFNVTAAPGQTFIVETSADLLTWTALSTNTLINSVFYFSDPSVSPDPQRFYRLRLP